MLWFFLSNLDLRETERPIWQARCSLSHTHTLQSESLHWSIMRWAVTDWFYSSAWSRPLAPGWGWISFLWALAFISLFSLNLPHRQVNRRAEQGSWHQDVDRHLFLVSNPSLQFWYLIQHSLPCIDSLWIPSMTSQESRRSSEDDEHL